MNQHPTDIEPITLAEHSHFYVGAGYTTINGKTVAQGGMYVEKFTPQNLTRSIPLVMFHGRGQTGTNYTGTPDGRRGWVHDFLRAGYTVYVVDQPERGRSGHSHQSIQNGLLEVNDVVKVETLFTAPGKYRLWPQAGDHTQWPGNGEMGDPVFDQFFASQVDGLADQTEVEKLNLQAGVELLEQIGPAILLTHSQSGSSGWLIADACPAQVKAMVALEPNGPPFFDVQYTGTRPWYVLDKTQLVRKFGLTRLPLQFEPPLSENDQLEFELQPSDPDGELVTGYLQAEPARQLPNLKDISVLILVAQASYHACYDHLTSAFLAQAGVDHEFVRLADQGFAGNGHMAMLEQNNHEVADLIIDWLQSSFSDTAG